MFPYAFGQFIAEAPLVANVPIPANSSWMVALLILLLGYAGAVYFRSKRRQKEEMMRLLLSFLVLVSLPIVAEASQQVRAEVFPTDMQLETYTTTSPQVVLWHLPHLGVTTWASSSCLYLWRASVIAGGLTWSC
jgi:hypothetical protein